MKEYLNPLVKSDYLSIQHVERYRFAIEQLGPGQVVLDIACGAGYGSAMLSKYGCRVVGADYDIQPISVARTICKHADFVAVDALSLSLKDELFDAVVSFETIEHVIDGSHFLSEMYRVLRPGGVLICSTPNIRYTNHPAFHLKEYEPAEFYGLVQQSFSQVEAYGQYLKPLDRAGDVVRWHMWDALKFLAGKTGTKETLKCMFRHNIGTVGNSSEAHTGSWEPAIEQAIEESTSKDYQVRRFVGARWLRNMVIVAKKGT